MGETAVPVLIGYLDDEQFGVDAAWALKAIFERRSGQQEKRGPVAALAIL